MNLVPHSFVIPKWLAHFLMASMELNFRAVLWPKHFEFRGPCTDHCKGVSSTKCYFLLKWIGDFYFQGRLWSTLPITQVVFFHWYSIGFFRRCSFIFIPEFHIFCHCFVTRWKSFDSLGRIPRRSSHRYRDIIKWIRGPTVKIQK